MILAVQRVFAVSLGQCNLMVGAIGIRKIFRCHEVKYFIGVFNQLELFLIGEYDTVHFPKIRIPDACKKIRQYQMIRLAFPEFFRLPLFVCVQHHGFCIKNGNVAPNLMGLIHQQRQIVVADIRDDKINDIESIVFERLVLVYSQFAENAEEIVGAYLLELAVFVIIIQSCLPEQNGRSFCLDVAVVVIENQFIIAVFFKLLAKHFRIVQQMHVVIF